MTFVEPFLKAFNSSCERTVVRVEQLYSRIRFSSLIAFGFVFFIVTGTAEARLASHEISQSDSYQAKMMYDALVAEMYIQFDQEIQAVEYYHRLADVSDDPAISKRVTELATATGQLKSALETSKRWFELSPDSLEAGQYLALLYLRNSRFKEAAEQLNALVALVNKMLADKGIKNNQDDSQNTSASSVSNIAYNGESLKFIGSMLAEESHHDKAYQVFKLYLQQYGNERPSAQEKVIAANLAMKAKNYAEVISSLDSLDDLGRENFVDAAVMKAKAYQKTHQTAAAIQLLNSIKDYKETKDSSRLELVRLLVLDKQKIRALPILQKLVLKHEKNNELLKSVIALEIDQSRFNAAKININKLKLSDKYQSDAEYFAGELLEKKGRFIDALIKYDNVKEGDFLINAHKKVIYLTQKTEGKSALEQLFIQKQVDAVKVSDKAYWLKLQADKAFDEKNYQQALGLYDMAIELSSDKTQYFYHRGLLHERMSNFDLAEKDFNFVLKTRSNDADALNALGYMLTVNNQRLAEAKKYIVKALEIKPNDPIIMDSLGLVLFKTGDLSSAEQYLRKAFRLLKNPEVASHLINVLSKSNQHHEAQQIFEEMNEKYPDNHILRKLKPLQEAMARDK